MDGLRGIAHGAALIGLPNALRAVGNALARDRADRALEPRPTTPHRTPGELRGASIEAGEVRIRFSTTFVDLRFPRHGQVSVGWQGALEEPSYAVVADAGASPADLLVPRRGSNRPTTAGSSAARGSPSTSRATGR